MRLPVRQEPETYTSHFCKMILANGRSAGSLVDSSTSFAGEETRATVVPNEVV